MDEELNQHLLQDHNGFIKGSTQEQNKGGEDEERDLKTRVLIESKKLWQVVGPTIITRIANYSMNVVTQAFAGHLGDVELASISIANNVIVAFNFGLLLGMATALETLCGQAFGAKRYNMIGIYLQRSWIVLILASILLLPSCWPIVYEFEMGVIGAAIALDISWWVSVFGMSAYALGGWCPLTWSGFSVQAFSGLWEFLKISSASGIMLCLEFWYYRILILMTGNLKNATVAVDALSICMSINGWELMIPFAFLAATGVRVANELGAGNGKGAKFAAKVSLAQSSTIGIIFCVLIIIFRDKLALIFSSSEDVITAADKLTYLLALTILLNSIQPVLSGVAVGSGWQSLVAYVNLGCYYMIGVPLGLIMGWVFNLGVQGIWGAMILGGTAVQTGILAIIALCRDWEEEARKAISHDHPSTA